MIKVEKSATIPESLLTTQAYDGQDVQRQLLCDQHRKCYICECSVEANYHIEHLNSQANRQDWNNLFLSCGYCNDKKLAFYDNILNPATNNIEDIIEQRLDTYSKEAAFRSTDKSEDVQQTIHLLENIYNGREHDPNFRTSHEEVFYDRAEMIMNDFMEKVIAYRFDSSQENESIVREELSIDKEMLGFKYWIIRDEPTLNDVFANDMIWNKQ
ncbi:MAG: HNH endonuclease [Prevotella sp.]|nr:HNH endonuclease [Prevotella sp.]